MHAFRLPIRASLILIISTFFATDARADAAFGEAELLEIADPIAKGLCEMTCETSNWTVKHEIPSAATAAKLSPSERVYMVLGRGAISCGAGRCTLAFVLKSGDDLISIWEQAGSDRVSPLMPTEVPLSHQRGTLPRVTLSGLHLVNPEAEIAGVAPVINDMTSTDPSGLITPEQRLTRTDVENIATELLLGPNYGKSKTEVQKTIVDVSYSHAAPCSNVPAWVITVHVPASAESNAIDGYLELNDADGKAFCIGLPFLDEVELSDLPLEKIHPINKESKPELLPVVTVARTSASPFAAVREAVDTLPTALKLIQLSVEKANAPTDEDKSDELAHQKTLLDKVIVSPSQAGKGESSADLGKSTVAIAAPETESVLKQDRQSMVDEQLEKMKIRPVDEPAAIWAASDETTEGLLNLKRLDIAELQARLELLGFDPNGLDGIVGKGLRMAVSDWQLSRSIPLSGFLDERQLATIKSESQDAFLNWIAAGKNAAALEKASHPGEVKMKSKTKRAARSSCYTFAGKTLCD